MPEMDDDRIADIVDQQLRYLRGEGPQPDLNGLTDVERADVLGLVEVVDALADSLPSSPPMEEDPVAIQLGLVPARRGVSTVQPSNPVMVSAEELAYRFGGAVEIAAPPAEEACGFRAALVCRSLAEVVLIAVYDADAEPTAADARELFHNDPQLSAVAFTTPDATAAAVVVPSDSVDRLVPMEGWRSPPVLMWEPLGIALGRHFDRSMPRWDEVSSLPPGDLLEDLADEAGGLISEKLGEVISSRVQLPHKRHARDFIGTLDASIFSSWVDAVRARRMVGEEIASEVVDLCRETP